MGSSSDMSILKGENRNLEKRKLHLLFEERLQTTSNHDDIAIIFNENNKSTTTYGELNETSNKIARAILKIVMEKAIPRNDDGDYIIAVSMLPSDKLLTTLLAIWKCGAAYLPIDPTFPEQRVKHILKESKPVLVIYDGPTDLNFFAGTQIRSFKDLSEDAKNQPESNIPEISSFTQTTENLAIVLYTSGSTGIPKGVRLPHDIILNRLQWQFNEFPYSKTEKVCVFKTALTFVDSVCEIWGPLLNGLTILVISKDITKDPQKLVEELSSYKIERLVLVPSLLRSLLMYMSLNNNTSALSNLKLWVSSGEPLTVALAKEFFQYFDADKGHVLCNFYGSTEIMGDVTFFSIRGDESLDGFEKVPIGYPLDNTIIYLLDNDLKPVPTGQTGELWVSGCNLAAGYVNGRDPDKFIANPLAHSPAYSRIYRTGDFASIYKGTLIYEGRTDSQIKIRGHRVDLSEVEKSVMAIEGVDKGVVLCYKPGEMDQALLAFVTTKHSSKITGMKIENMLQHKLPGYMIPQVVLLDNIPLLVNGKVDRQSLLKMYENTNNNDDTSIILDLDYTGIPESKMKAAEVLFKTVGSVIGRSTRNTLSLKSNYYQLGGNSLNSIYTITRLKEQGYLIGISDFIMAQNLGEILDKICSDKTNQTNTIEEVKYFPEMLKDEHKEDGLGMIVSSFYEKADLEQWLKPDIKENDYKDLLDETWHVLVEKDLSFIVRDKSGKPIAIALNVDVRDEEDIAIQSDSSLVIIFEFLEYVEGSVREQHLPAEKGKIVHSFMMATHQELSTQENVTVIQFMEEELVKLAKKKGYIGIFTTNTSPLTQQLGTDILGYETLLDYKVNEFVSSTGRTPFIQAPDTQRALVCLKMFVFRADSNAKLFITIVTSSYTLQQYQFKEVKMEKRLNALISEKDKMETQLVKKNEELRMLDSKVKSLQLLVDERERLYAQQSDDMRLLKIEIQRLNQDKTTLIKAVENKKALQMEMFNLERELNRERLRSRALEEALETPQNIHRWRKLEGTDPDTLELLDKVRTLQQQSLQKSQKLKELKTIQRDRSQKNSPDSPDEMSHVISVLKKKLVVKDEKFKAVAAELKMREAQVNEYKQHKCNCRPAKSYSGMSFIKRSLQRERSKSAPQNLNEYNQSAPRKILGGGFKLSPTKE